MTPTAPAPLICAVATAPERRALERLGIPGLLQTGIGPQRAAHAAALALDRRPVGILSIGTAAGLDPDLPSGALLLPRKILLPDGNAIAVDAAWHAQMSLALDDRWLRCDTDLLLVDRVLRSPDDKAAVRAQCGAGAADMESGAIEAIATQAGIPALALRVVADTANQSVPHAAMAALQADGNLNWRGLTAWLLTHPSELRALLQLRQSFGTAMRQSGALLAKACRIWPDRPRSGL